MMCLIVNILYDVFLRAGPIFGLLLISLGTGGIKPCIIVFAADQLEEGQVSFISFECKIVHASHEIKVKLQVKKGKSCLCITIYYVRIK